MALSASLALMCLSLVWCLAIGTDPGTDTWAVIVSSSKYFFNYRHNSNALTFYHMLKSNGVPDDRIILMLPEDTACSPRNPFFGEVFASTGHEENLYADSEVDFRGDSVTGRQFLDVLTGKSSSSSTLQSQVLRSGPKSHVFVYLSGHGGDGFLKFRDSDVLFSEDMRVAVAEMHARRRYGRLLLLLDTCQASTLLETVDSPGVATVSASARGENSFSYGLDVQIGVSLIDKMTFLLQRWFLETRGQSSLEEMLRYLPFKDMHSHVVATNSMGLNNHDIDLTPFFTHNAQHKPGRSNTNIQLTNHTQTVTTTKTTTNTPNTTYNPTQIIYTPTSSHTYTIYTILLWTPFLILLLNIPSLQ